MNQSRHEKRLERWLIKAPDIITYSRIEASIVDYHRNYMTTTFLADFLEKFHRKKKER